MTARKAPVFMLLIIHMQVAAYAETEPHPEAESAMAEIVLEQDFGEELKFHSRDVVTMARNDKVPGLNGLMFMRWQGDDALTEVTASLQWFENINDLKDFILNSPQFETFTLGQFERTTLWTIGDMGYAWTDGKHFLVSMGGRPRPPAEMVRAWLGMIESNVADFELDE